MSYYTAQQLWQKWRRKYNYERKKKKKLPTFMRPTEKIFHKKEIEFEKNLNSLNNQSNSYPWKDSY